MKTQRNSIATFILATLFTVAGSAQSATQHWQGTGTASLPDGHVQGNYTLDLQIQIVSPTVSKSVTTVSLPSGGTETITQTVTKNANGSYQLTSSLGKGGGACYGQHLCEFYIEDAATGKAVAVTTVGDADGSRRDLITVLQNGKAISILSEKLVQLK